MSIAMEKNVGSLVLGTLRSFSGLEGEIRPSDDLQEDLGIDSIEVVELVARLSKAVGVEGRRLNADNVSTVADLQRLIEEVAVLQEA